MANYIKTDEFTEVAMSCNLDPKLIIKTLKEVYPNYSGTPSVVRTRIANYQRKGLIPLNSGNEVGSYEVLRGTSTLYGTNNEIIQQWVKTDVPKSDQLVGIYKAIEDVASSIDPIPKIKAPKSPLLDEAATMYISNDIHFGLLTWGEETGVDWDTTKAVQTMQESYDYLFDTSPSSKVGIVVDLGDLTEADNFDNLTPKGKNPLDTDSRYPKVLRAAYKSLIYAITKALQKHEVVYFYNIAGNHDVTSGHAVREIISQKFEDNPRVIVDTTSLPIKYHQHGKTLIGMAHGDGLKMPRAGETMAIDCKDIFSSTDHRFFHFGHTHVDAVRDGSICRCESHRNIAPLNQWAYHKGYRRGVGTMKSITYSSELGEISRQTFNVITDTSV